MIYVVINQNKKMSRLITDFFDPNDVEHVTAYRHLCTTGAWPKDFLPDDVTIFTPVWQTIIMHKLAQCWVEHVLEA